MATYPDIGIIEKTVVEKTYEETLIEWRIPDFSTKVAEADDFCTSYDSPDFIVCDITWCMSLYPNVDSYYEFIRLYIHTSWEREYYLEFNVGLKALNGSVEQIVFGTLEGNNICSSVANLIKLSELEQRKSELAHQNTLTVVCKMRREISPSTETLSKTMPMKLIRLNKLSMNFKDLFGDKETCDTILKVKDKEYKVHRSVLVARSSVFAATFKHDTLERQTGVITISDCDPDSFQEFLEYLYTGKLEKLLTFRGALNLYYTSNKYDVEDLKTFCVEYLMQSLTIETICEIAMFAAKYEETQLFRIVQDFFNKNFLQIFLTSEWKRLMKNDYQLGNKLLEEMAKMKMEE